MELTHTSRVLRLLLFAGMIPLLSLIIMCLAVLLEVGNENTLDTLYFYKCMNVHNFKGWICGSFHLVFLFSLAWNFSTYLKQHVIFSYNMKIIISR